MSNGARKGKRNAHMMAVVALVTAQTAAAVREVEGEVIQPTSAVSADATYGNYRPHIRREKSKNHLSFNFHVSDGAFVYEPEEASKEYLDGTEPDDTPQSFEGEDSSSNNGAEDDDHEEIVAMTQGPTAHIEVKSTHSKTRKDSDDFIIVNGRAFEL